MSAGAADAQAVGGAGEMQVTSQPLPRSDTNGASGTGEENKFQQAIASWRSITLVSII